MMHLSSEKYLRLISRVVFAILPPGEDANRAIRNACLRIARLRMRGLSSYTRVLAAAAIARGEAAKRFPGGAEQFERMPWSFGFCCPGPRPKPGGDPDGLMCRLPHRELEVLLLQEGAGLSRTAALLGISEDLAASYLLWGKRHLAELAARHPSGKGAKPAGELLLYMRAHAVMRLTEGLCRPELDDGFLESLSAARRRVRLQAAAGKIVDFFLGAPGRRRAAAVTAAAVAVCAAGGVLYFRDDGKRPFRRLAGAGAAVVRQMGGDAAFPPSAPLGTDSGQASLYALHYALALVPDGFRLTEHYFSAAVSHAYYENEEGDRILFSQQVSEEPVVGFDTGSPSLTLETLNGHPAAVQEAFGLQKVYWYNGRYCYTLSTSLPGTTALLLARNAVLSPGCGPREDMIPLNLLPAEYTPYLARENGDVIFYDGVPGEGLDRLTAFIKRCENRLDGAVRLASFSEKGPVLLADLEMKNGRVYYTLDGRRNPDGDNAFQSGEEYERIVLETKGGNCRVLLYSGKYEAPLEVLTYRDGA